MRKLIPTIAFQSHRERRAIRSVLAVVLLATTMAGIHMATASADARMPVQISPQAPSVAAGEYLSYNAFVGCSIPEGCTNATFTFTKPPGASGPGVVAKPYPPGVTGVEQLPDGGVRVTFASIAVGTTKQLTVSWPTVDYYTVPGPQPVTMTGTADNADSPSSAETTMAVTAAPNPSVSKSGPAKVALDTPFTYSISAYNYSNLSRGGLALDDAAVVDHLPAGLEFVSTTGGGVWDPAARTITWHPDTSAALPGYQFAGGITYGVTVIAPADASPSLVDTTVTNTATLSGTPLGGGDPITKDALAKTGIIGTGTPVPSFTKNAPTTVGDGQGLTYDLRVTNTGTAIGAAVVSDTMPAAVDVQSVTYAAAGTQLTVTYADGSTADLTYTSGTLAIAKAGTRVASVVVHTPQIGIGAVSITKFWGIAHLDELPAGDTSLQNCAAVTMGGLDVSDCADTEITAPQVNGQISKSTTQAPVNPGGTHDWTVRVTSSAAPLYPKMIDLIPTQLAYVPGSFAFVSTSGGTCPAASDYDVSVVPDYKNGRDGLLIVGKDGITLDAGDSCVYRYTTTVKPGTPAGTYTGSAAANWIYLFDAKDQPFVWGSWDSSDIDKDGVTKEIMSYGGDNFAVAMASAAGVTKQVKGDRDTTWLRSAEVPGQEDQIGTSDLGGTVDWRVSLGNEGNRDLTDLVGYDLLPDPGSPGVTDGRYEDTKPYEWVPTLTGPIDPGSAPVTITYSTKADPCRPEMDATHGSASFWCDGKVDSSFVAAADVADWSKIRSIRFDFGDHVFPGGEYFTFEWAMDVPTVGPDGAPLHNGDETWNKVAVQAARHNSDGSTLPLLPAEAPWVVDRIYIPPTPAIDIEKADALGNDADTADTAVTVPDGATTDLVFTVTNTGEEPLTDVAVTDAVTDGDGTVTGLSCDFSPLGGPSTGTTWDGPLAVGASFTCTGTLSALEPGAPHVDSATVTGTGQETGTVVDDDDPFHAVTEAHPTIDIEKADAAGHDADTAADAVTVPEGDATDLTFTVTNDGNESLVDVAVTDAVTDGDGTVTGLSCDFSPLGGPSTGTTWDGPFAPGESFTCTGTLSALTPGVAHADVATVTGTGRHSGVPVEDEDAYHAITTAKPSVDIEKADAAGHDADTAGDAVTVPDGDATDLTFTVTNDGNESLVDVAVSDAVTDGAATVSGLSCDFSPLGGPSTGTTWAGPFEAGDAFTCTGTLSALTPGVPHADVATVTGRGQHSGTDVEDEDAYHAITTAKPSVDIEKADAAGHDADTAGDAVTVPDGDATDLTFTVSNDGNESLVDVAVRDAVTDGDASVSGLSCDFSPLGGPSTGTTWAGPFEAGDSFACTGTLSALTPGVPHADVATVTGTGQHSGTDVDDDDAYHAETPAAPAIDITKADAAGHDANTPDWTVTVPEGATTDLVFTIENTGNEALQDVTVSDAVTDGDATVSDLSCDFSPLGGPSTGTTWVGPFEAGDAFTCTATLSALTPGIHHVDLGTVMGRGMHSGTEVTDHDPYHAETVPVPAIGIEKADAAGHDADTPADEVTVPNDTETELSFTVTNDGNEPLVDVAVTDAVTDGDATVSGLSCDFSPLGGPSTGTTWAGPFGVGDAFTCTGTLSALTPGSHHVDDATVTGTGRYSGTEVTDHDPYHATTPPLVSVGDHVWYDIDRDGVQDAGEAPVEGVTVNLYDAHGDLVATTTTDADGFYSFTDLKASTDYQIEFVAPAGATFTGQDLGGADGADSDADTTTGMTRVFTTPATGDNSATTPDDPTWDAGIVAIDLTVTKALASDGPFTAGDEVRFTLTPHNNGPVSALPGWSVTDLLPEGLTLVDLAGTGYRCDVATATCEDATGALLAPDADGAPITVTATIDAGVTGPLHNVTWVTPVDGDIVETNPLAVPETDTDTSTTPTNNDDQASLEVDAVPSSTTTTTSTTPTRVIDDGAGHGTGSSPRPVARGLLPRTGTEVAGLAGLGALLALVGLGLVAAGRRRLAR